MLQIILILALCTILIIYFPKYKNNKPGKRINPPGPRGLPFVGNLHQFDGRMPHLYLYNLSKKYGPFMHMKLGFRSVIVISSAKIVKEVMKAHDVTFSSRPALVAHQKLSYKGLDVALSPYNDMWRETRKIYTLSLLSPKQVQSFHPIRKDEVSRMIKKIANGASVSKITDLRQTIHFFTNNIICRIAFGRDNGDEGYEENQLLQTLRLTEQLLAGFYVEDYFPSLKWIDKISGMSSKLEKVYRDLDMFYEEVIKEHLCPNRPESTEGDILDLLLRLKDNGSTSTELTMDRIKALIMDILVAGSDTSAAVSTWALTALIKNPTMMNKVQTEIRQYAGNKDLIDEDDATKLPYLKAVIKETLRLYPPAPLLLARETLQKCTVYGHEIEPKTMVYINAWAIARDPEFWENPNEFLPERFLDSNVDVRGTDPEVIPFGIGRRGCPGIYLGMAMIEIALSNLLYKFDWTLPHGMKEEDVDFDASPGVTMHKKNPLCLMANIVH